MRGLFSIRGKQQIKIQLEGIQKQKENTENRGVPKELSSIANTFPHQQNSLKILLKKTTYRIHQVNIELELTTPSKETPRQFKTEAALPPALQSFTSTSVTLALSEPFSTGPHLLRSWNRHTRNPNTPPSPACLQAHRKTPTSHSSLSAAQSLHQCPAQIGQNTTPAQPLPADTTSFCHGRKPPSAKSLTAILTSHHQPPRR